jgi:hypothetical protein
MVRAKGFAGSEARFGQQSSTLTCTVQKTELYDLNIMGNRLRVECTPAVHHNLVIVPAIAGDGLDV